MNSRGGEIADETWPRSGAPAVDGSR